MCHYVMDGDQTLTANSNGNTTVQDKTSENLYPSEVFIAYPSLISISQLPH